MKELQNKYTIARYKYDYKCTQRSIVTSYRLSAFKYVHI